MYATNSRILYLIVEVKINPAKTPYADPELHSGYVVASEERQNLGRWMYLPDAAGDPFPFLEFDTETWQPGSVWTARRELPNRIRVVADYTE